MNAAANTVPQPQDLGKVLVVDDEVLIRMDVAQYLRTAGFDVVEAWNGDEALTLLRNVGGVALVITDLRMPGKTDGEALASWLRRERPGVKVIMVSGHLPASRMPRADAAFDKPVDPAALLAKVEELLAGTPK
jgi:DNA-binding response OmpR family regulator